jgi:hypothetical protein
MGGPRTGHPVSDQRLALLRAALGFLALEPRALALGHCAGEPSDREVPVCGDARSLIFRTS